MRKLILAVLAACFLLIIAVPVSADVVVQPENAFFASHRNDCIYLGRDFIANGLDGFVAVHDTPDAKDNGLTIENGEVLRLEFSCLYEGVFWGFAERHSGWVKIDGQLSVLYDYVAFQEAHVEELYHYEGDYAALNETKAAAAWPWPGADAPLWTIEDLDMAHFSTLYAYQDAEGREWGFVTYLHGSPNVWFCLSDPLNRELPAFNPAPAPMPWESDTAHTDIAKTETPAVLLIVVLVAGLVVGTAVLIKVFWKPGEEGAQNG